MPKIAPSFLIKFICLVELQAVCIFSCFAFSAEDIDGTPTRFKAAGGEIPMWSDTAITAPENGDYPVTWHYPVFLSENRSRLQKLNGWARTRSLEELFRVPELSREFLGMKDSRVLAKIGNDKETREAAGTQSELIPTRVFGQYILFTLYQEWLGGVRPQHRIRTFVFDYGGGEEIPMQSLFKDGAEDGLKSLLSEAIANSFRDDKAAYNKCLKDRARDRTLNCERQLDDNDVDACINWRAFDWNLLLIEGSRKLSVQFPYEPGRNSSCGDGIYVLEGGAVETLFLTPERFRNGRVAEKWKP